MRKFVFLFCPSAAFVLPGAQSVPSKGYLCSREHEKAAFALPRAPASSVCAPGSTRQRYLCSGPLRHQRILPRVFTARVHAILPLYFTTLLRLVNLGFKFLSFWTCSWVFFRIPYGRKAHFLGVPKWAPPPLGDTTVKALTSLSSLREFCFV